MPTPIIPSYAPKRGDSLEARMKSLENAYLDLTQQYEFLMQHLDSKNVKRLFTEYCNIRSAQGETVIQGPLLIMKDKQGVPVVRLKMGYDPASTDFVYQLMNAAGDITVNIDSSGNLTVERGTFKGSITIGTGNDVIKADNVNGLWVGHADFASAPFRVTLAGGVTATSMTIIGGTIKTAETGARIELSGNALTTYNSGDNKNGISWGNGEGGTFGDVSLYDDGVEVLQFYNNLAGGGFTIMPIGSAVLGLGAAGKTTLAYGGWNCSSASFTELTNGTSLYATRDWVAANYSPLGHTHP